MTYSPPILARSFRLLVLAASSCIGCSPEPKPAATADTGAAVRWLGRVDLSNPEGARFAWSGSGLVAKVSGPTIKAKLTSDGGDDVYFQPVIDGKPAARFKASNSEPVATLAANLPPGEHVLELYRENEGKFSASVFGGFVEGTLVPLPPASGRLIEVVGDSISAGYGNLGSEQHPDFGPDPNGGCRFSTESESAYLTYGAIAARTLDAEVSILALSGWGAYRDNGNSTTNVLGKVYENTLGTSPAPAWGFERKAAVVVLNLGTNDFASGDPGQAEFQSAYSALLATVRGKYPDAWIFCMIGPMLWGDGLRAATTYITAAVDGAKANGDAKLRIVTVSQDARQGTGCDWHPNVNGQRAMAERLVAEIRSAVAW